MAERTPPRDLLTGDDLTDDEMIDGAELIEGDIAERPPPRDLLTGDDLTDDEMIDGAELIEGIAEGGEEDIEENGNEGIEVTEVLREANEETLNEAIEEDTDEDAMRVRGAGTASQNETIRRDSTMSDIPLTNEEVLAELKRADEESRATVEMMQAMKTAIEEIKKKPQLSDEDGRMLQERQIMMLKKLSEFEDITRKMQRLVGLADLSSTQFQPAYLADLKDKIAKEERSLQREEQEIKVDDIKSAKSRESKDGASRVGMPYVQGYEVDDLRAVTSDDELPKVVVCGRADEIPRIVICKSHPHRLSSVRRCSNSINALKKELATRENAIQCMKVTLCALEIEMRRMVNDNFAMKNNIARVVEPPCCACLSRSIGTSRRCPTPIQYPTRKSTTTSLAQCPYYRPQSRTRQNLEGPQLLQKYNLDAKSIEYQLVGIEKEVERMKAELAQAKKEGQEIEDQQKLLQCALPENTVLQSYQCCRCPRSAKHRVAARKQCYKTLEFNDA